MGQFHRFLEQRPQDIVEVRKRLKLLHFASTAGIIGLLLGAVLSMALGGNAGWLVPMVVPFVFAQVEIYDLRRSYWELLDAGAAA